MRTKPILGGALALPLAACISFGPKTPPTLMTLTADARVAADAGRTAADATAIGIGVPAVSQALATLRVPVQASPTAVAYLKGAQWVEPPARLFRALLAETVEARTGRVVADPRGAGLAPATRVDGRLAAFGLDAAKGEAVVTYDAVLTRAGRDGVATRRFEAHMPVAAIDAAAAPDALNRAANQVAGQVAEWIGG